jgi:hypothetical protein
MKSSGPASLRNGLLVATWLAGTLLATGAVYAAVSAVGDAVTEQSPAPISQSDIEHALTQARQAAASPSAPQAPATPSTSPAPPPPISSPAGGGSPPSSPPARPSTASRTFVLVGGSANFSCSGGQIVLNWATPNQGFVVETGSSDGGAQIEVRFRSDNHESRLEAWCSAGQVQGSAQEQNS